MKFDMALVSGSENGARPAYVSWHGLSLAPSSFQRWSQLRFRSTPLQSCSSQKYLKDACRNVCAGLGVEDRYWVIYPQIDLIWGKNLFISFHPSSKSLVTSPRCLRWRTSIFSTICLLCECIRNRLDLPRAVYTSPNRQPYSCTICYTRRAGVLWTRRQLVKSIL